MYGKHRELADPCCCTSRSGVGCTILLYYCTVYMHNATEMHQAALHTAASGTPGVWFTQYGPCNSNPTCCSSGKMILGNCAA
jgi:hypothetical protein